MIEWLDVTCSWSSLLLDSLLSSGDELKSIFSNCCKGSTVAGWSSIINYIVSKFGNPNAVMHANERIVPFLLDFIEFSGSFLFYTRVHPNAT